MTTLLTVLLILALLFALSSLISGMIDGDPLCWMWFCLGGLGDLIDLIGKLVASLADTSSGD